MGDFYAFPNRDGTYVPKRALFHVTSLFQCKSTACTLFSRFWVWDIDLLGLE